MGRRQPSWYSALWAQGRGNAVTIQLLFVPFCYGSSQSMWSREVPVASFQVLGLHIDNYLVYG